MTKTLIALATVGFLSVSSATVAAAADFTAIDANSDGFLTLDEVLAIHNDWTETMFLESDVDQNGALNEAEYQAAVEKSSN